VPLRASGGRDLTVESGTQPATTDRDGHVARRAAKQFSKSGGGIQSWNMIDVHYSSMPISCRISRLHGTFMY
jgi:hypothetical protein